VASKSSRRNLAETIHNLCHYYRDLPPEKISAEKIHVLTALVKSASQVFAWPTNRQLSFSVSHPSRRYPAYYEVRDRERTQYDLIVFASR